MDARWVNGLVFAGIVGLLGLGGTHREARLVGADALGDEVAVLEEASARRPDDALALGLLAQSYLDRAEPGLAMSALGHAAHHVRSVPHIAHLYARALFDEGRARDALAIEREALAACDDSTCRPWFVAQATRRVEFFQAVVDSGIEDPAASPEATRAAYDHSQRQVRLAAR